MNVKEVTEKAGISRRFWNYLLLGQKNAGQVTAKRLSLVLGVEKGLWIFGTAKQRQAAWRKALKG